MEGTREYRNTRRALKTLGYRPGMTGAGARQGQWKQAAFGAKIEQASDQLEPAALATARAEPNR